MRCKCQYEGRTGKHWCDLLCTLVCCMQHMKWFRVRWSNSCFVCLLFMLKLWGQYVYIFCISNPSGTQGCMKFCSTWNVHILLLQLFMNMILGGPNLINCRHLRGVLNFTGSMIPFNNWAAKDSVAACSFFF